MFPGRIHTGWVVGTGMKEDDGTVRSGGNCAKELVAGETDRLGIIVLVGDRFYSDVPEDSEVVDYRIARQACLTPREAKFDSPQVGSGI